MFNSFSKDCYSLTTIVVESHKHTVWWMNCYLNQYSFQQLHRNHCLTNLDLLKFPEGNAPSLQEGKTRFGTSFGKVMSSVVGVKRCCDSRSVDLFWVMIVKWRGKRCHNSEAFVSFNHQEKDKNGVKSRIKVQQSTSVRRIQFLYPVNPVVFFSVVFVNNSFCNLPPNCSPVSLLGSILVQTDSHHQLTTSSSSSHPVIADSIVDTVICFFLN